jgi:hypothetical protein
LTGPTPTLFGGSHPTEKISTARTDKGLPFNTFLRGARQTLEDFKKLTIAHRPIKNSKTRLNATNRRGNNETNL